MKFQVFDGDKPAQFPDCRVDKSWDNSVFDTEDEALVYARKWCAPYGSTYDGTQGFTIKAGEKYDYSGYGDFIEIRVINN